jgi:ssDNA-binding Zn-finger/Zn-ribbon topoisomerase 1
MPTFQYEPEAGDIARCPKCSAEGMIERVYRGKILTMWKHPGQASQEVETRWSHDAACPYCGTGAVEKRWWRR